MIVWLVEDNEFDVAALRRAAKRAELGWEIETFGSGEDVVARIDSDARPPALAILDLDLPGMSGVEVARALGAIARPTYRAILSTSTRDEDRRASREAGAHEYCVKSLDFAKLAETLRGVDERARAYWSEREEPT